uniref:Sensory transduction histidine kinase n=1 Tax=Rhizophora mucronata TaxID=61149 RepID=A0A2P2L7E1_RHIMU
MITGMWCNSLSCVMYFNIFIPFFIGRSTSVSMMSISGPSELSTSITCLADLTDIT